MAIANTHPPPPAPHYQLQQAPPQQHTPQLHSAQQRPSQRPRKSRTFSFRSDKSQGSSGNHKIDLHETSAEKEAKRLHSKADPTLAMQEAEPCKQRAFRIPLWIVAKFSTAEVAATVKSSMAPLRSIQHRDSLGNPIGTVPDSCRKPWRKANPSSAHSRSRPFKSNAEQMGTPVRHDPEFRGRN